MREYEGKDDYLQMWFRRAHPYDSDPDWQKDASCGEYPVEWWYPERGAPRTFIDRARNICADCPIRIKCLQYALYHNERIGIWGGTTPDERKQLAKTSSDIRQTARTHTVKRKPVKHGTYGGWAQHIRRDEEPCEPCRKAKNNYQRKKLWAENRKNQT